MKKPEILRSNWWLALGLVGTLTACGGGDEVASSAMETADEASASAAAESASTSVTDIAALSEEERLALAALHPDDPADSVRYIVTLNPAAVGVSAGKSASVLSATGASRDRAAAAVQALGERLNQAHGATVMHTYTDALHGFTSRVSKAAAAGYVESLKSDPAVLGIELDRIVQAEATPSVRAVGSGLWGLDRIDQAKLPLSGTYQPKTAGTGVTVHVLDTGINPNHTEFSGRTITGTDYVLDGRSWADCHGHGTHVAGTVGGATFGVAAETTLVAARVLGCTGSGSYSSIINAINGVIAKKSGPTVINMSIGGPVSDALDAAVDKASAAGIVTVVAAGNSATDACTASPARAPSAITTGATTSTDDRASFSNYGTCVDVYAPGQQIQSAAYNVNTGSTSMSGTSMASPHVAGAAAVMLAERPWLTPAQVDLQLKAQAVAIGAGKLLQVGTNTTTVTLPVSQAIHIDALTTDKKTLSASTWAALVTAKVVNASGQPVSGAVVTGYVAASKTKMSCTTVATGLCTMTSAALPINTYPSTNFTVAGVTGSAVTYQATDNTVSSATIVYGVMQNVSVASVQSTLSAVSATTWRATEVIRIVNASGVAVPGATVTGTFAATRQTLTCTTGSDGSCALTSASIPTATYPQTTFTLTGVAGTLMTYVPSRNNLSSNVISLVYLAPTVVHVGSLTGSASATSTTWSAKLTATVHDASGKAVSGATVKGIWSATNKTLSCVTATNGTCTVTTPSLQLSRYPLSVFTLTQITGNNMKYDALANQAGGMYFVAR